VQGVGLEPRQPEVAVVTVKTRMPFGREEHATAWIERCSGAALQSTKLRSGRKASWRLRRYTADGYSSWRASPSGRREARLEPEQWSRRSTESVLWPHPAAEGLVVTDSYALLYLLSAWRLDRADSELTVCISAKGRLVEAHLKAGELVRERCNFVEIWDGQRRRRKAELPVRVVSVVGRIAGSDSSAEGADLDLLGMRDEITILVEEGTGIPLEVRGRTEDLGKLRVRLQRVLLARPPEGE
jgi:hypothetical protein